MKLLKNISDAPLPQNKKFKKRLTCRIVLFDKNNLVSLLFVSKRYYHKIPGGGIKKDEDKRMALIREVLEETGCKVKIDGEVGKIIEYRSNWNLYQESYCYFGRVLEKGQQNFTQKEKNNGFRLIWLSLEGAIDQLKKDKPLDYEGKFIQERDLRFLQEVNRIHA